VQLRDSSFGVALVIDFLGAEVSLFCWQIEYPMNVHLIRGNHEAADINALFGFRIECIERLVCTFLFARLFFVLCLPFSKSICHCNIKIGFCCDNIYSRFGLRSGSTGGTRWHMGMATHQSTFQLVATCCSDREEDHLHAWWNWKVNQSRTTN